MPGTYIAESRQSIQYTGSNSAEIDSLITDLTIDSETGGVLTVTSSGSQYEIHAGDWINYWQGYINGVYTNAQFNFYFIKNVAPADYTALANQVGTNTANIATLTSSLATVGGQALRSAGVASAPTLVLGSSANVAVQLVPAMPDTNYTAQAYIFGTGINLGNVTINAVTKTSAGVVTVNVSTGLASLPGVQVLVTVRA